MFHGARNKSDYCQSNLEVGRVSYPLENLRPNHRGSGNKGVVRPTPNRGSSTHYVQTSQFLRRLSKPITVSEILSSRQRPGDERKLLFENNLVLVKQIPNKHRQKHTVVS